MAIVTRLTEGLNLDAPILLAPMAGVSGGELAGAVSRAGGLGFIGGGYCDPDWIRRELDKAGDVPVGVGFITWALEQRPAVLDMVLERQPKAIFLSFGKIDPWVSRIKAAGVPILAQVQSLRDAYKAAEAGADFIVAQGTEAGGHGGARATLPLVPAIVDALGSSVPVIAAGGIADGRGLAAALMLGADGVLCGTAFFVAQEALAAIGAKSAAVGASGDQTARGSIFDLARGLDWPEPWTLRALRNRFSRKWEEDEGGLKADLIAQQQLYRDAVSRDEFDTAAVIVGEAIDLVRAAEPAAQIFERILRQSEDLLKAAPTLLGVPQPIPNTNPKSK